MTTKVCPNSKCPAYAHFVYTVAMRCVLCRCDLIAAQRNADMGDGSELRGRERGQMTREPGRAHAAR